MKIDLYDRRIILIDNSAVFLYNFTDKQYTTVDNSSILLYTVYYKEELI